MRSEQANDMAGLTEWFTENYPKLLKAAWFCDRDLAEDIAQDASVKIVKAWSDPRQRESIRTSASYVNKVVINSFRSHLKAFSRANRREVPLKDDQAEGLRDSADLTLRSVILELPEDERSMLMLRYEGYTILEAGRALGLSRDQAYRLNGKAKQSINRLLED